VWPFQATFVEAFLIPIATLLFPYEAVF
jgi:hypothetical protein